MAKNKSKLPRNGFVYLIIISTVFAVILSTANNPFKMSNEISVSETLEMVQEGSIQEIVVQGEKLSITTKDGSKLVSSKETGSDLIELMRNSGIDPLQTDVNIIVKGRSGWGTAIGLLFNFLPIIFFAGLILFMMRQAQGGSNQTFGFGKSKARKFTEENKTGVTFKDVAGVEEAKIELSEIVEFLKEPGKFRKLGAKVPKGVLLVGPPGTGKTLLAKAVAGEANVPFFSISGSEFVEMFVGVGASRVRDLFGQAKINAPCIIFIDEIDAVGRHRGAGLGGGNDEREQTLNQLLVEMDGFDTNEGVIIIAATNRPDVLDPALLRPGRFDRQVVVSNPDIIGREKILKVHVKKIKMGPDVNLRQIARGTINFSGADLANLVNEAALLAARNNKKIVTSNEFEEAKDKVMMGAERKSMVMTEEDKKLTAYHEGGHAIVALNEKASDPIHKATIIPRAVSYTHLTLPTNSEV